MRGTVETWVNSRLWLRIAAVMGEVLADSSKDQHMQHRFQRARLAPDGLAIDEMKIVADSVQIRLRSRLRSVSYPDCGGQAREFKVDICGDPLTYPSAGDE
jgi:hypothetical protein